MKKIVIIGAGQAGKAALALINRNEYDVSAFGDNNQKLWNNAGKIPVLSVSDALGRNPDTVLISVLGAERTEQLKAQIRELGYGGETVSFGEIQAYFDIRCATLWRIAERITQSGVSGCIAELGVYRGDFARRLNVLFPDRKLYLFDTFRGFDENDLRAEGRIGQHNSQARDFSDTSAKSVLAGMPHKEQVVLKTGRFPETADMPEERFALVSIDADLYAPTLAGLEFFYPRLSIGGVIMLHDYNSGQFEGVRRAVAAYEAANTALPLIPLCDIHGTAVIIKA